MYSSSDTSSLSSSLFDEAPGSPASWRSGTSPDMKGGEFRQAEPEEPRDTAPGELFQVRFLPDLPELPELPRKPQYHETQTRRATEPGCSSPAPLKVRRSSQRLSQTHAANLRIPPEAILAKRRPSASLRKDVVRADALPEEYIKIKLTVVTKGETLALKLSKGRLQSLEELVDVVSHKLRTRYAAKGQASFALMFPDRQLAKVDLSGAGWVEPLLMEYIDMKSKIHLEARI